MDVFDSLTELAGARLRASAFAPFVLVVLTLGAIGAAVVFLPGVLALLTSAAGLY